MIKVTRRITLDFQRKSNVRLVYASQSDMISRVLVIKLLDDGAPCLFRGGSGYKVAINVLRPDGRSAAFSAKITGIGEITYQMTSWPLGVAGDVQLCVAIYGPDAYRLTTPPFTVHVAPGLYLGNEIKEDTESQTAFANMMSELAGAELAEEKREANELQRKENESARKRAESSRAAEESSRNSAELTRSNNEEERVYNENMRNQNETNRINVTNAMLEGLENLIALQETYIARAGGTV